MWDKEALIRSSIREEHETVNSLKHPHDLSAKFPDKWTWLNKRDRSMFAEGVRACGAATVRQWSVLRESVAHWCFAGTGCTQVDPVTMPRRTSWDEVEMDLANKSCLTCSCSLSDVHTLVRVGQVMDHEVRLHALRTTALFYIRHGLEIETTHADIMLAKLNDFCLHFHAYTLHRN